MILRSQIGSERVIKQALGIIAALLYVPLIWFFGAMFGGAGHGTDFFVRLVFSPFSLGFELAEGWGTLCLLLALLFWAAVLVFLALRRVPACRGALFGCLLAHYFGILATLYQSGWSDTVGRIANHVPQWLLVFLLVYISGQVWFWYLTLQAAKGKPVGQEP